MLFVCGDPPPNQNDAGVTELRGIYARTFGEGMIGQYQPAGESEDQGG